MTTDSRYTDLRAARVLVTADTDSIQEKQLKSMHWKLTVTQIKEKNEEGGEDLCTLTLKHTAGIWI